jgi:hypothetical protein
MSGTSLPHKQYAQGLGKSKHAKKNDAWSTENKINCNFPSSIKNVKQEIALNASEAILNAYCRKSCTNQHGTKTLFSTVAQTYNIMIFASEVCQSSSTCVNQEMLTSFTQAISTI